MRAPVLVLAAVAVVLIAGGVMAQGSGSGGSGGGPSSPSASPAPPQGSGSGGGGTPPPGSGSGGTPPPGSGSGGGGGGGGSGGSGGSGNGTYTSPSPGPLPSYTPGPTPYLGTCGEAAILLPKCHREGPFSIDPTYPGPAWTVPPLDGITPYNPCCQYATGMINSCYNGLQGVFLDWQTFAGSTRDRSDIIEAYLTSCPNVDRTQCITATLAVSDCVQANIDGQAAADAANTTFSPADCCGPVNNLGHVCQGWNSIQQGSYGSILTTIPSSLFTDVQNLLHTCPQRPQFMCEAAVQRVSTCMEFYGGLPGYDDGSIPVLKNWTDTQMQFTQCCNYVPMVNDYCQGNNMMDAINSVASANSYLYTNPSNLNRYGKILKRQIEACTPIAGSGPIVTPCDDVVYGIHIWNGKLVSKACNSHYAISMGCIPVEINNTPYFVVRPDVPDGLIERTDCEPVPV